MSYFSPLSSALVTYALLLVLIRIRTTRLVDIPNERSLHTVPTPRTGGIALMAGIFSGWVLAQSWIWWIVAPTLGLFVLSLVDDVRSLSPRTRLICHFIAALIVSLSMEIGWFWLLPVMLCIVWMTNLYNFMDGSDGLAGGMALFGFSAYGIAGLTNGNEAFALLNFSIAAAALGFLFHNFPPARVFMGDAGSIPLGFLAAALGVIGWQRNYWPIWFPALVFSPFVADATVTLCKRTMRGEKVTQPHRSHYYQRVVQMGWSHRNTALAEYTLMLLAGLSALYGMRLQSPGQALVLTGWCIVYLLMMATVDHFWRRREDREAGA